MPDEPSPAKSDGALPGSRNSGRGTRTAQRRGPDNAGRSGTRSGARDNGDATATRVATIAAGSSVSTPVTVPERPNALGPFPEAAEPRSRRIRRSPLAYLLPVRLWQVVIWQLAVLAALAGLRPAGAREVTVLAVGGLAVAASSVRIGGLTGGEWAAVAMRFQRARVRSEPASAADALQALLPSLQIRTHTDRAGNTVGIAGVGDGWSAVVRLAAPAGIDPAQLARVLDEAYRGEEIRLAAAQLVIWTVAPNPDDALGEPARTLCLAVRYRAADDPQATRARGGGELGALRATASATFSLARRLDDAGYACSVLDGAVLHEQLLVILGAGIQADRLVAGGADPSAGEMWQGHAIAAIPQSCYRPSYGADPLSLLGRACSGVAFTCESYTLRRRPRGRIGRELIVRAGPLDPDAPSAAEALAQGLATALDRLDGRHGAYTRSTLPLALD